MNLENLVTSKTLSEQIAQYKRGESLFWWVENEVMSLKKIKLYNNNSDEIFFAGCGCCSGYLNNIEKAYPSYTATELGELMKDFKNGEILYARMKIKEEILVPDDLILLGSNPEALGQIYLYLLKSGVIK